VEEAVTAFEHEVVARDNGLSGTIRVTTTGGAADRLRKDSLIDAFHALRPDFQLELVISDRTLDLSAGEADLAIRSGEPRDESLIGRKIADVPWAVYASRSYIQHHGAPQCVADIDRHVIVTCSCSDENDPVTQWLRLVAPHAPVVARCETRSEQLRAVKSGAGIAPLLTHHGDADLIRVIDITDLTTPYYLLMHETMRYRPRVRAFADFVTCEIKAFRASISGVEVDRM
jgi:DNA-binding transcriptional LysR family regulator